MSVSFKSGYDAREIIINLYFQRQQREDNILYASRLGRVHDMPKEEPGSASRK
jgi:hypothetical protein